MPESLEERMQNALLAFIDILYAVVFGLILVQTFQVIILPPAKPFFDKVINILLVIGVFYFLAWEWLHARRLTLRNPYSRYRRFFIEVFVAFLAYGAALEAIRLEVIFLLYILLILFFGELWALSTLIEYPDTCDSYELRFVIGYQPLSAAGTLVLLLYWYFFVSTTVRLLETATIIILGLLFLFGYEVVVARAPGIMGGPGVPFLSRAIMEKFRSWLTRRFGKYIRRQ